MAEHEAESDRIAQVVSDHRLQPRWRSGEGAPAEDHECLCGGMFWGVAEWSYHVAALLTRPGSEADRG